MLPQVRRSLLLAALLAIAWGVGLAVPALLRGDLLGHGWTDLYPSVWGMWGFANAQPGLPATTSLLGAPDGMGFYYSSPIKGWLAWPLLPVFGLTATWNLLTIASRVGTVLAAWAAGRAWGLRGPGALVAAAAFGCAPFFHGYAVEGIGEGTDGWTLALLLWALGKRRPVAGAGLLALTILSSWYLGAAGCLLALMAALRDRSAIAALAGGLLLSAPALMQFGAAFSGGDPLPDAIRAAMGASLQVPTPGLQDGIQPFAMTAYTGFSLGLAALAAARRDPRLLGLAAAPVVLSLGIGPWYDLPVLESLRFPYRWHAATLAVLALAAGRLADDRGWMWLGPLIALEGVLLSPVEPVIPGADPTIPPLYDQVTNIVLDIPGPVAMPPGQLNPSRLRSRYLLYFQTRHSQPSPWVPDFNSVGVDGAQQVPRELLSWDPLVVRVHGVTPRQAITPHTIEALREAGVGDIVLHRRELTAPAARRLRDDLIAQGAAQIADDGERWLLRLPQ